MSELRFNFEWTEGNGVVAPELAATWARLEVWVGPDCVSQVEDHVTSSARRAIYCPLYPLAEWIGFNWWLLQANVRPASVAGSVGDRLDIPRLAHWNKFHHMRAAGDGFHWPNLVILPEGASTRVVWRPDRFADISLTRYLPRGEAFLDSAQTQRVLAEFVDSVLARLDAQGVNASPLAEEWQAITSADLEERAFCVASARLGLDPYSLDADLAARIEGVSGMLTGRLLADFLDSVDPNKFEGGLKWINRVSRLIGRLEMEPNPRIHELRREALKWPPPHDDLPWTRGYRQARMMRTHFDLEPTDPFPYLDMVGIKKRESLDHSLQAFGGVTDTHAGALVLGRAVKRRDANFLVARSLWHFAFDDSDRFLLTAAHADRQRVERSFAAELLVPAAGLEQLLGGEQGFVTTDEVNDAADHFGAAPFAVRHQIENQLDLQVA